MQGKVLIITLNFNQSTYTLDLIKSILDSNYDDFQILLIDNGSSETNRKVLEEGLPTDKRLLFHKNSNNLGYVGGLNYGFSVARDINPMYILIMNNDTIIDKSAISELVSACQRYDNNAIVSGKVYHYDDPERLQYIGAKMVNEKILKYQFINNNEIDIGQYNTESERDMLDDIYWLFPYKLINEIGVYSDYFWFNAEQMDFALRGKKAGYKLIYTPEAKLWHKGSLTQGGRDNNPRLVYYGLQGSLIVRYLHLPRINFFFFYLSIMYSVLLTYIKAIGSFITGQESHFRYAYAKLIALLNFTKWIFVKGKNNGSNPF